MWDVQFKAGFRLDSMCEDPVETRTPPTLRRTQGNSGPCEMQIRVQYVWAGWDLRFYISIKPSRGQMVLVDGPLVRQQECRGFPPQPSHPVCGRRLPINSPPRIWVLE